MKLFIKEIGENSFSQKASTSTLARDLPIDLPPQGTKVKAMKNPKQLAVFPLKMMVSNKNLLSQGGPMFRCFDVSFREGNLQKIQGNYRPVASTFHQDHPAQNPKNHHSLMMFDAMKLHVKLYKNPHPQHKRCPQAKVFPVQLASSVIHLEVFLDVEHGEPVPATSDAARSKKNCETVDSGGQPSAAGQASQRVVFQAMPNLRLKDFLSCVLFKMCYTGFTNASSYHHNTHANTWLNRNQLHYPAQCRGWQMLYPLDIMWHNLNKGELCRATRHDQILHITSLRCSFFQSFSLVRFCVAYPLPSHS